MYPYDYLSSIEKIQLPPNEEFCSKLNDCDVSDKDYEREKNI